MLEQIDFQLKFMEEKEKNVKLELKVLQLEEKVNTLILQIEELQNYVFKKVVSFLFVLLAVYLYVRFLPFLSPQHFFRFLKKEKRW
jgi:hypothetical protein